MRVIACLLLAASLFGTAALAEEVAGVYTVPLADESLAPFGSFPVRATLTQYAPGLRSLVFSLPAVLVGEEQRFSLSEKEPETGLWEGPGVSGFCQERGAAMSCRVRFSDLAVSDDALRESISAFAASPAERAARHLVARQFGSEPIGILEYQIPSSVGP